MSIRFVQCVPNFSEGQRPEVVRSIADAISAAGSAKVIDYSWDVDHNRSVITIVGEASAVRAAMLAGAAKAVELIDLNEHLGEHPRIGAIDVVPVVPVEGCTMDDCVELSWEIAQGFAEELGIPVFFYEKSALPGRESDLPAIRKGGFEALKECGLTGARKPDMGPSQLHPTAGASIVGARGPLIAYNVNLNTSDLAVAKDIAKTIRQLRTSGHGMPGVRAIGVSLKSRNIVQVSTNITQPHAISVYDVYSFIARESNMRGVDVLESELIGALRQDAVARSFASSIKLPGFTKDRVIDSWL